MTNTTKGLDGLDYSDVLERAASNDGTLGVGGFTNLKVGHRIERQAVSSTIDDYRFLDVVASATGTLTASSAEITALSGEQGILPGQFVISADVPMAISVSTMDSNTQLTMSDVASGSSTGTIKFANLLQVLRVEFSSAAKTEIVSVERIV